MLIKIEEEIEHCYQCPYAVSWVEQGAHGTDCSKIDNYASIPDKGIRKDCPFRETK